MNRVTEAWRTKVLMGLNMPTKHMMFDGSHKARSCKGLQLSNVDYLVNSNSGIKVT